MMVKPEDWGAIPVGGNFFDQFDQKKLADKDAAGPLAWGAAPSDSATAVKPGVKFDAAGTINVSTPDGSSIASHSNNREPTPGQKAESSDD
jgi:hypothetical protein